MIRTRSQRLMTAALTTASLLLGTLAPAQSPSPPAPGPDPTLPAASPADPNEPEVLTRGPVHEAFAEPVVFDPRPGVVVTQPPPAPIEEQPPDLKPEGEDVVWVPGYWYWDDEREDYLWVSGIWRDIPPDRQWVPGYWNEVEGGVQWVSGYWAPTQQDQAIYLPQPPATLEVGPNIPSPTQGHVWTPGYWTWVEDHRYIWHPGCWVLPPPQWVWVPPHYVWSPCGYVFVGGYWDYPVASRGVLFAPVYFPPVIIAQPAYVFTPGVVIQSTVLVDHFFCRPSYAHYYFGDFYAPVYRQSGFFFGLAFNSTRFGFDPIYAHTASVNLRFDIGWTRRVQDVYAFRVTHIDARPAWTFAAQRERTVLLPDRQRGRVELGMPLVAMADSRARIAEARGDSLTARGQIVSSRNEAIAARAGGASTARSLNFERLDDTRRAAYAAQGRSLSDFRTQRVALERDLVTDQSVTLANRQETAMGRAQAAGSARASTTEAVPARSQAVQARSMERSPLAARAAAPAALPRPPQSSTVVRPLTAAASRPATRPLPSAGLEARNLQPRSSTPGRPDPTVASAPRALLAERRAALPGAGSATPSPASSGDMQPLPNAGRSLADALAARRESASPTLPAPRSSLPRGDRPAVPLPSGELRSRTSGAVGLPSASRTPGALSRNTPASGAPNPFARPSTIGDPARAATMGLTTDARSGLPRAMAGNPGSLPSPAAPRGITSSRDPRLPSQVRTADSRLQPGQQPSGSPGATSSQTALGSPFAGRASGGPSFAAPGSLGRPGVSLAPRSRSTSPSAAALRERLSSRRPSRDDDKPQRN